MKTSGDEVPTLQASPRVVRRGVTGSGFVRARHSRYKVTIFGGKSIRSSARLGRGLGKRHKIYPLPLRFFLGRVKLTTIWRALG